MVHPVNDTLAAAARTRQVETTLQTERVADAVDAVVVGLWNELWAAPERARGILSLLPAAIHAAMTSELTTLALWSHRKTADDLLRIVPAAWFMPARQPIFEDKSGPGLVELLVNFGVKPADYLDPLREPTGEISYEDAKALIDRLLFPSPPEDQVRAWVQKILPPPTFTPRKGFAAPNQIADVFSAAFAQGKKPSEISKEILPLVDNIKSSARRTARTWGQYVAHQAQEAAQAPLADLTIGYQIHATLDQNTRPKHAARNGQVYYLDPKPGQLGMDRCPNPPHESQADGSVVAWNCILPGQWVQGRIRKVLKAWYSGQAFEIRTASGSVSFVTRNHPVLTENGFAFACQLKQGQKLWSHQVDQELFGGSYEEDCPSLVENLFVSFQAGWCAKRATAFDLYGNGEFIQGEIRVVWPDGSMIPEGDFQEAEQGSHFGFVPSDNAFMGSRDLCGTACRRHRRPFQGIGSRLPADRAACRNQCRADRSTGQSKKVSDFLFRHPTNIESDGLILVERPSPRTTDLSETIINRVCANSEVGRAFVRGKTVLDLEFLQEFKVDGNSFLSLVTSIRSFHYSGPVYDVETDTGTFLVSSGKTAMTMNKNCRCHRSAVLRPPTWAKDESKLKVFRNASDQAIPDPHEYATWFDRADERRRRLAVGSRRYQAVLDRGGSPQWADFIDPKDGEVLSLKRLEAEPEEKRAARVAKVNALIQARASDKRAVATFGFLPVNA